MILVLTLSLAQAILSPAFAADKPVCDSNVVTRNCEFFKERKKIQFIKLPDGSQLQNPLFSAPFVFVEETNVENQKDVKAVTPEEYDKLLKANSDLQEILETAPVSRRFRMAYIERALQIGSGEEAEVLVPWPANDNKASTRSVKVSDISETLQKTMSAPNYKRLTAQIKMMSDPIREKKLIETQKIRQAEAEALRKEQAEEKRKAKEDATLQRKKDRVKELYVYVKEQMEAVVRRGRTNDKDLSKDELILIQKIQTARLDDLDSDRTRNHPQCAKRLENAFYDQENHTFTICEGKLMNSEADLVYAIAHELGHGVDQCGAKMPLYEVNYEKLETAFEDSKISADYKNVYQLVFGKKPKYLNSDLTLATNADFVKHLEQAGILKKLNDGVKSYPFQKEYRCFVDKNHFTETKPKEIQASVEFMETKMKGTAAWKRNFTRKSVDRYKAAIARYPQCMQTMGPTSTMRETMSDMMAALVAEKFILENPFKSEGEKVAALTFARAACGSRKSAEMKELLELGSLPPNMTETMFSSPEYRLPHADDDDRVKRIALNLPGMAKVFDCKRDVPACIDHLSFSKRMSTKPLPAGQTEGTR